MSSLLKHNLHDIFLDYEIIAWFKVLIAQKIVYVYKILCEWAVSENVLNVNGLLYDYKCN